MGCPVEKQLFDALRARGYHIPEQMSEREGPWHLTTSERLHLVGLVVYRMLGFSSMRWFYSADEMSHIVELKA